MKPIIESQPKPLQGGLFDTRAASRLLGVSKSFLDKKRVAGGGPLFCKVGSRVLYDPEDLQQWLVERRYASTSEVIQ